MADTGVMLEVVCVYSSRRWVALEDMFGAGMAVLCMWMGLGWLDVCGAVSVI